MAGTRSGNGEGTITKRADGRWEARVTLGDGRRKCFYGRTRAEVAKQLAAAIRDRDLGAAEPRSGRLTVSAFATDWLARVKPSIRPRTHRRYAELLAHVTRSALGAVPIAKLTPMHVERLYAAKLAEGLSPTTVHHLHSVLHHLLEDALRKGVVVRNVTDLVDAPRMARKEMHVWSADQAQTFLEAVSGERLEALYVLALTTGMRQGEILALRWRDVDLEAGVLQVRATLQLATGQGFTFAEPKTAQSRRRIKLAKVAAAALREHRVRQAAERLAVGPAWTDHDLVFPNALGEPMDGRTELRTDYHRAVRQSGLPPIRFHDLRHTAATTLLARGINPKIVSELLGHASIRVTLDTYSHVLPDMQQQAAAVMDAVYGV